MSDLSLLTYNCFGAPGLHTTKRLHRLAHELNRTAFTIVCLQEVQTHAYRRLFAEACQAMYPHQAYQPFIHAPMGGLLTMTEQPIEAVEYRLYRERGLWYTPAVTDWILHKGILRTCLRVDNLPVTVLNTHLTANYTGDWSESNPFARQEHSELMELAEAVRAQPADHLVIACGDFNIPRGSWMYQAFIEASGLLDPLAGDTRPTFRPHRGMSARYAAPIDYALIRPPKLRGLGWSSDLQFHKKLSASRPHYLSDHNAIELRLTWG